MIRRTPIKRSSKPRAKRRGKFRRGRIVDKAFIAWCHDNHDCLVAETRRENAGVYDWPSPCVGRKTFHHVKETPGAQKNDRHGFLLCEGHHQIQAGPDSIERIGKQAWQRLHGIDIEEAIARKNAEYEQKRLSDGLSGRGKHGQPTVDLYSGKLFE